MRTSLIVLTAVLGLSAGTAMAQSTVVIAPQAPPPIREEIIPAAPATDGVWQPGRWSWSGTQYVWVAGQYVARPRPQVAWIPGHWDQTPAGWAWVDGSWQ
jgi:hypothetical protein